MIEVEDKKILSLYGGAGIVAEDGTMCTDQIIVKLMKKRKFGKLDWEVSEIGLGCWQIGADWGNVSEDKAKEVLKSSFENGVNFFDTADVYGMGRSEKFVGEFIKSVSERIYVATKAGRQINPHVAEGYYDKALMESYVDQSLSNLNVETIDLLQMHCPPTEVYSSDKTFEMLDYLVVKEKYKIMVLVFKLLMKH